MRQHYMMPETNPLFAQWRGDRDGWYVRDERGSPIAYRRGDTTRMLPIIPLVPSVATEIPQYRPPQPSAVDCAALEQKIGDRLTKVAFGSNHAEQ